MPKRKTDIEPDSPINKTGLVITAAKAETLSRQQEIFNRLIKRIETLREELQETASTLDTHLEYHNRHLYPMEVQMLQLKKDILKLLFSYYKDKNQLSQNQRKGMLGLIRGLLQRVLNDDSGKPDEEIQRIFEMIEGVSYADAEAMDFESMKDNIEETLRKNNIYADLGDMHKDMSAEEMARKMHELNEMIRRQREAKTEQKAAKKKSKKQAEKLEKEKLIDQARSKNISNIYKQLVKVLHPDLERDESQRAIKEELMKQLGQAYKNNDLHALLKLELEWISRTAGNAQKLTDDKLSIYNEVLKEQVQELEQEMQAMLYNPRYRVLDRFMKIVTSIRGLNLAREKKQMEAVMRSLTASVEKLKGSHAMAEIKDLIRIHREEMEQ